MANALRHETPFDAMLGEAPREIAARGLTISAAPVAAQIAVTGDMAASAAAHWRDHQSGAAGPTEPDRGQGAVLALAGPG